MSDMPVRASRVRQDAAQVVAQGGTRARLTPQDQRAAHLGAIRELERKLAIDGLLGVIFPDEQQAISFKEVKNMSARTALWHPQHNAGHAEFGGFRAGQDA
ncbi:MAG TPA: hypothetical protein VGD52_15470 [Pseudoduganella sp.]